MANSKEWQQVQVDIRAAYHRLFKTRDGEVVMADLKRRYYDMTVQTDADMHRVIGQRDVVLHILNQLERTDGTRSK